MKNYIPCCICSKKAHWSYMPGKASYCENCVPRGCSCNQELKEGISDLSEEASDPANYIEKLDDFGRKLPCCEYMQITDDLHEDKEAIALGYEAYYDNFPEKRQEDEEIEHWEHRLGEDK